MGLSFNSNISKLNALGKRYSVAEMNVKILAKMPRDDWFMKVTALKERDLSSMIVKDVFSSLQAYEFYLARMIEHKGGSVTQSPS